MTEVKQRALVAVAGVLLSASTTAAFAESSVTLYGIIDTGIEYVSHANAAGDRLFRMPGITGEQPSRWGIRGTEDLGGGYSAIFTLESGFNTPNGASLQGGRLFGRQAFVGIKSPYGTISFGRQYTMTVQALTLTDILGADIYGIGVLDQYIPNARADNSVVYVNGIGGFTFGVDYSFGRDSAGTGNSPGQGTCAGSVPGDSTECREWSAMLTYTNSLFGVVTSYEEQRGGTKAAASFFDGVPSIPISNAAAKDARTLVSAYVNWAGVKLSAGWLGRRVVPDSAGEASARSNIYFAGASYFITPTWNVDGEMFRTINAQHDTRATMGTIRTTYHLSKQTSVYAQVAYLANSAKARFSVSGAGGATPAAGVGQTGAMLGVQHLF